MKPQKQAVLHIIPTIYPGGIEKLTIDLIKHLSNEFDQFVWFLKKEPNHTERVNLEDKLKESGAIQVKWVELKEPRPSSFLSLIKDLHQELNKENFDIVHCHDKYYIYPTAIALAFSRRPRLFATLHSLPRTSVVKGLLQFAIQNLFAYRLEKLVCISKAVYNSSYQKYRKTIIYNGIELKNFNGPAEKSSFLRKNLGVKKGSVLFLTIANLRPGVKGFEYLIPAFKRLTNSYDFVHLAIVGEEQERGFMESLMKDLDSIQAEKIHFLGGKLDVVPVLRASDVYVCASEKEGLGIAVMEAMASNLPVLSTDAGGLTELVSDHVNGLVVPKCSVDQLFQGMVYFVENKETWHEWGWNGKRIIEERFSIDRMTQEYRSLYLQQKMPKKRRDV